MLLKMISYLCCVYIDSREYKMTAEEEINLLKKNNENTLEVLGAMAEGRSLRSLNHIRRVKVFSGILSERVRDMYPEYGINTRVVQLIANASSLHDIGKISVPESILFKPGRLSPEEFEQMKTHTIKGCEFLEKINEAWEEDYKQIVYDICRSHHEKYDGKGYPDGLVGDEIPIAAQIVSIADVYDALVCDRCYADAFSKEQAFTMIVSGECGEFNPKLLECFRRARISYERVADVVREKGLEG